ncbi:hypothetical protein LTR20_002836 [Exophiala xenobiotica]|nr:hypothetical protein LTR93_003019 [Exophiala xenobiotica]KAK5390443.1 hypothetical protein LTS13_000524 [Exophiala xenobiotica]KAK5403661.1 hypothetical protein LTR79_000414 [Exophiala xenobiotica]KAK5414646.1 hypothetical protein LTR06_004461 [Exophiala xenobiotica]KAK5423150.1 hypothetical protein LTR90_002168 [Exophiala xenobiotica]
MASSFRRLAKDHAQLQCALPPNYLFPDSDDAGSLPDDLTQLNVLITGAEGTPYSQGLWRLHLTMPHDYPKNPPKATFKTRIYHPNIEESTGAVCLETLKRDWQSSLTLKDILITISCLLIQPNPDSALNAAAGALIQEDYDGFATQARLMTRIHAPIPRHLAKAVEEAKRRGEEDQEEQTSQSSTTGISRDMEGQPVEDNTKENDPTQSASLGSRLSGRLKRPLSDAPESDIYGTLDGELPPASAGPPRKSPKMLRGPLDQADKKAMPVWQDEIVQEEDKENVCSVADKTCKQATVMPRPTTLRKISNVGGGRRGGQPRVGIRRL